MHKLEIDMRDTEKKHELPFKHLPAQGLYRDRVVEVRKVSHNGKRLLVKDGQNILWVDIWFVEPWEEKKNVAGK